jgi:hypothetical protein
MRKTLLFAIVLILPTVSPAQGKFSFKPGTDRTEVLFDSQPFATFHYAKEWPKPFLHDLRAPSGTVVTRGFPIATVPGENKEHPWQRGLWFAHGDIAGIDFWREGRWEPAKVPTYPLPLGLMVVKSPPRTRVAGGKEVRGH